MKPWQHLHSAPMGAADTLPQAPLTAQHPPHTPQDGHPGGANAFPPWGGGQPPQAMVTGHLGEVAGEPQPWDRFLTVKADLHVVETDERFPAGKPKSGEPVRAWHALRGSPRAHVPGMCLWPLSGLLGPAGIPRRPRVLHPLLEKGNAGTPMIFLQLSGVIATGGGVGMQRRPRASSRGVRPGRSGRPPV